MEDFSRVSVLIPCKDEEATVARVVKGFQEHLPGATVWVYDNNSTDGTFGAALEAGAEVRSESRPGKGSVVRRMFADIEAEVFLLVDGDDTYAPSDAPLLVKTLEEENLDMVVTCRCATDEGAAYRSGHVLGNRLLTGCVRLLFGQGVSDMLSGYRAFSRRYVKSFPCLSQGFEIETEMTVHALDLMLPVGEIYSRYGARPEGSSSKLSTYRDGWRILKTILRLTRDYRPFEFFGAISLLLIVLALALGVPLIGTWLDTGLVPRFPTAILATGVAILGALTFFCGLLLCTSSRYQREQKRLLYLNCSWRKDQ